MAEAVRATTKRPWRCSKRPQQRRNTGAQFAVGALLGGEHDVSIDSVAAQAMFQQGPREGPSARFAHAGPVSRPRPGREVGPVRAREALTWDRAGEVAELAALPPDALDETVDDESGPVVPDRPVPFDMADLESAPEPEFESVTQVPVSAASPPHLSLMSRSADSAIGSAL